MKTLALTAGIAFAMTSHAADITVLAPDLAMTVDAAIPAHSHVRGLGQPTGRGLGTIRAGYLRAGHPPTGAPRRQSEA